MDLRQQIPEHDVTMTSFLAALPELLGTLPLCVLTRPFGSHTNRAPAAGGYDPLYGGGWRGHFSP